MAGLNCFYNFVQPFRGLRQRLYIDMIKQLIEDLAHDNITLGQGLTRAKLIASKTHNSALKEWVNRELQGYENGNLVPEYRKIPCQTSIVVGLPFGYQDIMPIAVSDPKLKRFYNELPVTEAITHIKSTLKDHADKLNLVVGLPGVQALMLAKPF